MKKHGGEAGPEGKLVESDLLLPLGDSEVACDGATVAYCGLISSEEVAVCKTIILMKMGIYMGKRFVLTLRLCH